MLQLLCSAIRNKRGENPKLDAGSVTVQPEPKGNAREKKKRKWNIPFQNMPYKLSMSNHNSNNKKYKNIVTTRSSWSPPHHFRRCGNNTDGGNMYTQQYEHERRTWWHFRSPDHLDFYFVLSWYFRPERWWETVSGFLLRSEQQSAFLFFFSSLISFRFVRLYVLLSPSDCHDDHQAGNRLSGIRGRDIKKNQAIPGEWAPSSLVSVIGRRMSFQRAKLSDILLDNEQVVSIYKERIFIPPLVPLQNVVAYNIIGRRRQPTRLTTGGPKDWRELLHGASTIRGM